jgi:hypothetical protein
MARNKVRAIEYVTDDGRLHGWYVPCGRGGHTFAGFAALVPGLVNYWGRPAPWLADVKYYGRYGLRHLGRYQSLTQARMWVLGGNGHITRGSSSVAEVRPMSRANILALPAGPNDAGVTGDTLRMVRPPWQLAP